MSHKPTPYEAAKSYLGCTPDEAISAAKYNGLGDPIDPELLEALWIGLHALRVRPAPQRKWQERMRSQGRCRICGTPLPCETHRQHRKKP